MKVDKQIGVELGVHGKAWNSLHDGYFSDPSVASPLLDAICLNLGNPNPDVLVDLGGGTGFILSQLLARGATDGMALVDMDCSDAQLAATAETKITRVHGSIDSFQRRDLGPEGKQIFFIMRSAFHYFGENGLIPALRHVRSQARDGEIFVHQTACFHDARAAACINSLYQKMGTKKWYPLVGRLSDCMAGTDWRILHTCPAPPLKLTSIDLERRYGLTADMARRIRDELMNEFGEIENIFQPLPDGFVAHLPYNIFATQASR